MRTTRCWNYGYGDTYHLVAELEVQPDGQGAPEREFFDVYSELGEHVLSGRVRRFVARIPTKIGELRAIETVLAIEALEDTRLVVRGPARPPPEEPYLGGVPAD